VKWSEVESKSNMLIVLWTQYASLSLFNFDGVLYRSAYDSNGLVVHYQFVSPHELHIHFLELIHNNGHLMVQKCIPNIL